MSCKGCLDSGMGASLFLGCSVAAISSVAFRLRDAMSGKEVVEDDNEGALSLTGSGRRRGKRDILAMQSNFNLSKTPIYPPAIQSRVQATLAFISHVTAFLKHTRSFADKFYVSIPNTVDFKTLRYSTHQDFPAVLR